MKRVEWITVTDERGYGTSYRGWMCDPEEALRYLQVLADQGAQKVLLVVVEEAPR